jgi:deazaflavin-dependent oxidoreductase (nitroreductase family)
VARPENLNGEQFCDLTTVGRSSGKPRTVELWFGAEGDRVYFVSGGGMAANWVKNIQREPGVTVAIGGVEFQGRARVLDRQRDGESWQRGAELCCRKYYRRDASYLDRGWSPEAVVVEAETDAVDSERD